MKTTLAPGSKVVTEYYERAGLDRYLEELGFNLVGYGCTTCIGNTGPLPDADRRPQSNEGDLVVAPCSRATATSRGASTRDVQANYLASPPLVVAYALAGRMDIDLDERAARHRRGRQAGLPARHLADAARRSTRRSRGSVDGAMFERRRTRDVFNGDERWRALDVPAGRRYAWDAASTYVRKPPFFDGMTAEPGAVDDIARRARARVLGDSVTTDHISPAGSIATD